MTIELNKSPLTVVNEHKFHQFTSIIIYFCYVCFHVLYCFVLTNVVFIFWIPSTLQFSFRLNNIYYHNNSVHKLLM